MTAYHIEIDAYKSSTQIEVQDEEGEIVETRRLPTEELESFAQEYEGHEAALEAGSNHFAIYDTLSESLDVTWDDMAASTSSASSLSSSSLSSRNTPVRAASRVVCSIPTL